MTYENPPQSPQSRPAVARAGRGRKAPAPAQGAHLDRRTNRCPGRLLTQTQGPVQTRGGRSPEAEGRPEGGNPGVIILTSYTSRWQDPGGSSRSCRLVYLVTVKGRLAGERFRLHHARALAAALAARTGLEVLELLDP